MKRRTLSDDSEDSEYPTIYFLRTYFLRNLLSSPWDGLPQYSLQPFPRARALWGVVPRGNHCVEVILRRFSWKGWVWRGTRYTHNSVLFGSPRVPHTIGWSPDGSIQASAIWDFNMSQADLSVHVMGFLDLRIESRKYSVTFFWTSFLSLVLNAITHAGSSETPPFRCPVVNDAPAGLNVTKIELNINAGAHEFFHCLN